MTYIKSKKFCEHKNCHGLALLSILIICSVIGLAFLYIVQTNSLVGQSYEIRKQENYLYDLQEETRRMEIELVRLESPINLEQKISSLNLVEAGKTVYLEGKKMIACNEQ